VKRSPFESASFAVQEWLDRGAGSASAKRDTGLRIENGCAWDIDLRDDALPVKGVRLVLPPDFPASPCALYVSRDYFLRLPHIEADGHVCLGLAPIPEDYGDPVAAVVRAFASLKNKLLVPAADARWVSEQFDDEHASYWAQWCLSRRTAADHRPVPNRTYVDVGELDMWATGGIAGYVPGGAKRRHFSLQVAAATEAHELAARHRWADGTLIRGSALFVRLPDDAIWTPSTWPKTFEALDSLVAAATDDEVSLSHWVNATGWEEAPRPTKLTRKARRKQTKNAQPGQRPMLVVLVHGSVMFGYQLYRSTMPKLQPPAVEPVHITRIDADWVLARDHNLDVLHARRKKRVLLLGAGSLGSPLARALARAGVGHLDIVDAQLMETENTSRHELGLADAGRGKAHRLAEQIMKDVPGIAARGYLADASTWAMKNCKPGVYDLVIECTAESSVRTFMSHMRNDLFGDSPVIHAWTEPLCSAAHVVLSQVAVPWPDADPADELVNASDLSANDTRIKIAACAGGFHPYGAADIELVAAFAAERVIAVLDDMSHASTVWSWVRSSAFFDSLPVAANTRSIVPSSIAKPDSATTTRELAAVLGRR
jgi:hypothetical protein